MMKKKRKTEQAGERSAIGRARKDAMFPATSPRTALPSDYAAILADLKQRIQQERLRTVMAANAAMVLLYWDIGRTILERQDREGWGARVIDRLSTDLRDTFPGMQGLSPRNLKYMRAFAAAWPDRAIVQQLAAQIPWFHNCILLDRVQGPREGHAVTAPQWSPGSGIQIFWGQTQESVWRRSC